MCYKDVNFLEFYIRNYTLRDLSVTVAEMISPKKLTNLHQADGSLTYIDNL